MDLYIFWCPKDCLSKPEASADANSPGYGLPQCPELASAHDPHVIFLCDKHDGIAHQIKKSLRERRTPPCYKVIELDLLGENDNALQKKLADALSKGINSFDELPDCIFFATASMPPSLNALLDNSKENIADYHFREYQGNSMVFKPIPVLFSEITGKSHDIIELRKKALAASKNNLPILITGEVGTGRKRLAKALHDKMNGDHEATFKIDRNVAAGGTYHPIAPKDLLESVNGGTLVIYDIDKINPEIQVALYETLHGNGEKEKVCRQCRIISISSQPIPDLIKKGAFLPELYFLLAGITLELPPLRKRPVDIPLIAAELLNEVIQSGNTAAQAFNKNSLACFKSIFKRYAWPGNISELKQAITEAVYFSEGNELQKTALPSWILKSAGLDESVDGEIPAGFNLSKRLADIERNYIENGLKQADGQKSQAAKILGLESYQALDSKLKKLKVKWNEKDSCLEDNDITSGASPSAKRRRKKNDPVQKSAEGSLPEPQTQEENSLTDVENALD